MNRKLTLSTIGTIALLALSFGAAPAFADDANSIPEYDETVSRYSFEPSNSELIVPLRYALIYDTYASTSTVTPSSTIVQELTISTLESDPFKDIVVLKFPTVNQAGDPIKNIVTAVGSETMDINIQEGTDKMGVPFTQAVLTERNKEITNPEFKLKVETYGAVDTEKSTFDVPVYVKTHKDEVIMKANITTDMDASQVKGTGVTSKVTSNINLTGELNDTSQMLPSTIDPASHNSPDSAEYYLDTWEYDNGTINEVPLTSEEILANKIKAAEKAAANKKTQEEFMLILFNALYVGIGAVSCAFILTLLKPLIRKRKQAAPHKWYEKFEGAEGVNIANIPETGKLPKIVTVKESNENSIATEFDESIFNENSYVKPIGFTFNEPTLDDGTVLDYYLYPFLSHSDPKATAINTAILALVYGCVGKGVFTLSKTKDGRSSLSLPDKYPKDALATLTTMERATYNSFLSLLVLQNQVKAKVKDFAWKKFAQPSVRQGEPAEFTKASGYMVDPENLNFISALAETGLDDKILQKAESLDLITETVRKVRSKKILSFTLISAVIAAGLISVIVPFSGWYAYVALGAGTILFFRFFNKLKSLIYAPDDIVDICRTVKGSAYLARYDMYRNYLMIVNEESRYSVEKADITASVLPWTIVFNLQNVWADVFAVQSSPRFIMLAGVEVPTLYLKRVLGLQIQNIDSNEEKTLLDEARF